ncbi:MAG: hypothetical protein M3437_00410 [Chloroflexota bacterium]|nr:hypothetical protein [Chloroflexota bacterium]MDQ5865134.1 hypothetical protein [Chloroflexota bacterium]
MGITCTGSFLGKGGIAGESELLGANRFEEDVLFVADCSAVVDADAEVEAAAGVKGKEVTSSNITIHRLRRENRRLRLFRLEIATATEWMVAETALYVPDRHLAKLEIPIK